MERSFFYKALIYAIRAHRKQRRKYSDIPYILHPMEVCEIVATMDADDELMSAALLHDTVEDTDVTMEDIDSNFSDRIVELVKSETENKREDQPADQTWKIRKEESLQNMINLDDRDVKKLWLADKLSNIRSSFRMYLEHGDDMWQHFNQKDKKEQEWYYRKVAEATSDLAEYPAWREYNYLVNLIFGGKDNGED